MNRAVARRDTSHGADIAKIDIEALTLEIKKLKELVSFANLDVRQRDSFHFELQQVGQAILRAIFSRHSSHHLSCQSA